MRALLQRIWLLLVACVFFLTRILGKACNALLVLMPVCAGRLRYEMKPHNHLLLSAGASAAKTTPEATALSNPVVEPARYGRYVGHPERWSARARKLLQEGDEDEVEDLGLGAGGRGGCRGRGRGRGGGRGDGRRRC